MYGWLKSLYLHDEMQLQMTPHIEALYPDQLDTSVTVPMPPL